MAGPGYETLIEQTTGRVILAKTLSDAELIAGARDGYNAYIGELQRRFGPALEQAIRHVAGESSQEVVDDVFMSLPRRLETYAEVGKFDRWLYGVAFNLARTRMRSERRRREEPRRETDEDPAKQATGPFNLIERETVERAAAHLPSSEREAWLLAYEGHTAAEIARRLGISANAAAVRLHRARRRLSEILELDD